ncbi:MAG: cellulase family glycosylhydrolase [Candidatus Tantalella remota]|nr:cellulase family glycosylhydrolase [Candidatus Tantalella remota]
MKYLIFVVAITICIVGNAMAQDINVTSAPEEVGQYKLFLAKVKLPHFADNPNDQSKVTVTALITAPSGKTLNAPLFNISNSRSGKSVWELRFTPREAGKYEYFIQSESTSFRGKSATESFKAAETDGAGFLHKSANNDFYLTFDSGKPFFGIGHNIGWVHENSPRVFDRYFKKLQENGANLTRVWLCHWAFRIEWEELGKYEKEDSRKLDKMLEVAAERGIYIMLCFDTYGSMLDAKGTWGEERWSINPYNKKNGGPCETPEDFFTNPEAKKWYKSKLKYFVSRWSHSPNIFAFELWNEYDAPAEWVKEMAGYIEEINPHGQFVTTSMGYPFDKVFDEGQIWELEEMGIVTLHSYGNATGTGRVSPLVQESREAARRYKKPFICSEFGIDFDKDDKEYDPHGKGIALHNSIWASAMSKSFGTAMNWWYDTYVRPKDLYPHYGALSSFLEGVDWDSSDIAYAETGSVMVPLLEGVEPVYRDVRIKPSDKWEKIYTNEFTFLNNGDLAGAGLPNKYLHGKLKKKMQVDHIFHVDFPKDSRFIIRVGTVSQGADLHVYVDGKETMNKVFPAGPGEGPWKRSLFLKKYKVYQCVYNEDFVIDVPKGEHTIRLSNTGKDWLGIEKITLKDYVDNSRGNARCLGLRAGKDTLLWVQNRDSNWRNAFGGNGAKPITGAYIDVSGMGEGPSTVEWWDTYTGSKLSAEKIVAKDDKIRLEVPEFLRDIACKIREKR